MFKTAFLKYKFRVYGTNLKIKGKPVKTIGNKLLCDGFYKYGILILNFQIFFLRKK